MLYLLLLAPTVYYSHDENRITFLFFIFPSYRPLTLFSLVSSHYSLLTTSYALLTTPLSYSLLLTNLYLLLLTTPHYSTLLLHSTTN